MSPQSPTLRWHRGHYLALIIGAISVGTTLAGAAAGGERGLTGTVFQSQSWSDGYRQAEHMTGSGVAAMKEAAANPVGPEPAKRGGLNPPGPLLILKPGARSSDLERPIMTGSAGGVSLPLDLAFEGIAFTNDAPPDPAISAGPDGLLLAMTNGSLALIEGKGSSPGTFLDQRSLSSFFGVPYLPGAFDPKTLYDQLDGHFIAVALSGNAAPDSYLELAVSKHSNPTNLFTGDGAGDDWWTWEIDADLNGGMQGNYWADYDGLGVDQFNVYVTANMMGGGSSFHYSKLWIIPKAQLYSGHSSISFTEMWDMQDPPSGVAARALRPAHTYGTPSVEFVPCQSFTDGKLTVFRVTDPGGTPALDVAEVDVPMSIAPPPSAEQLDGPPIDTGGPYLHDAVFRSGRLYTAEAMATADLLRSRVRGYAIRPTDGTVTTIEWQDDEDWLFYPAIMPTGGGDIAMVFSRVGPTSYGSCYYAAGLGPGSPPYLSDAMVLQSGVAPYERYMEGDSRNRWGDYGGIALDPDAQNSVWMMHEYASAVNEWGTWIGHLPLPGADVWVDFTFLGPGNGTFSSPYNTLAEGVSAVAAGGTIVMRAGSSTETPVIDKNLWIKGFDGPATVGD